MSNKADRYIMDAIYHLIPIDCRLFQLIDTSEFQRLRYIKQLGTSYFCFPSATHTRFSHSIGTSYLAGQIFDQISKDKSLDLRPVDKLMLQSAGLLHDIGHGPFSHLFESEIVPIITGNTSWNHEQQGLKIIDHIFDQNNLDLFDTSQIKQIKGMITGELPNEYGFLKQIISNSDYGIDVDRLDYMNRDCHAVGLNCGYNPSVVTSYIKVIDGQIAYNIKRIPELYQFYHTRYNLYKQIYHHPTTKAVEYMLVDAIINANSLLKIEESLNDIEKYIELNDGILDRIRLSNIDKSKQIIKKIDQRKFYKYIKTTINYPIPDELLNINRPLIQKLTINYGLGNQNPLLKIPLYSDDQDKQLFYLSENQCPLILPNCFQETSYRIFQGICTIED